MSDTTNTSKWSPKSKWHIVGARTMVHIHDSMGFVGVSLPDKTVEDRRRNEYLVNAVNSFDALREALRRVLNQSRQNKECVICGHGAAIAGFTHNEGCPVPAAERALALAEEGK